MSSRVGFGVVALYQVTQSHAQSARDRQQLQYRWIVDAALQPAHHIGMDTRPPCQCRLIEG